MACGPVRPGGVAGAGAGVALLAASERAGAATAGAGGRWHAWRWCGAGVRVPSGPIGPTRTTTGGRAGARFDAMGGGSHLRISSANPTPILGSPTRLRIFMLGSHPGIWRGAPAVSGR